MKDRFVRRVLIAMIGTIAASISCSPLTHAAELPGTFVVFDALFYSGKPDLARLGMLPARGTGELWRAGQPKSQVDQIGVQRAVSFSGVSTGLFYLDVEHWPVSGQPDAVIDANIAKLIQMTDVAHQAQPGLKIGFYGIMPEIVYWPIVKPVGDQLEAWRRTNRRTRELARHVDVIFPSLYTFYTDRDGWETYARETLKEAKLYGKPVYAFLWPEFHNSNRLLGGQNVPRDYWRKQLEFCRLHADGIVIWGGWQKRWDEDAGWWQETKLFLQTLRDDKP